MMMGARLGLCRRVLLVGLPLLFWAVASRAYAASDVVLDWAEDRWYNPSLVVAGDKAVAAVKVTRMKKDSSKKTWWINTLRMCQGQSSSLQSLRCKVWDPWQGSKYTECEFDDRVRGGKLDTSGLGDVKLWRWEGKGVYAIFSRKPRRNETDRFCRGFVVYQPWIAQVVDESDGNAGSLWTLDTPLALHLEPAHAYPQHLEYTMEKNWMPFVHKDVDGKEHVYVTYNVIPHMVFEVLPDGRTVHRWTTSNEAVANVFGDMDVHGGPPIAYVPAHLSASAAPYYLGVLHSIERFSNGRVRLYRHFAFKVSPQPPFEVTAVSDELPLVFDDRKARTAFVAFASGLDVTPDGRVVLTYGSADVVCRAMTLSVAELEGMMTGGIAFRNITVPYDRDTRGRRKAHVAQQRRMLRTRRLGSGGGGGPGVGADDDPLF